ncbi:hypothetical protein [Nocardioides sp. NPDC047086]
MLVLIALTNGGLQASGRGVHHVQDLLELVDQLLGSPVLATDETA